MTPRENVSYGDEHCEGSKDGTQHCNCWYEGEGCCWCSALEMTEEAKVEQGMVEGPKRAPSYG